MKPIKIKESGVPQTVLGGSHDQSGLDIAGGRLIVAKKISVQITGGRSCQKEKKKRVIEGVPDWKEK